MEPVAADALKVAPLEVDPDAGKLKEHLRAAFDEAEKTSAPKVETQQEHPTIEPEPGATGEKPRDEKGRFAPKEKAEAAPEEAEIEEIAEPEAEEAAPEQVISAKRPPNSWTAAAKADWEKLPPAIQDEVLKREKDYARGLEERGTKANAYSEIEQLLEPYRPALRLRGFSDAQGIKFLLDAQAMLDRDPVNGLVTLARSYGVDLTRLNPSAVQQPQNMPGVPPQQIQPFLQPVLQEVQTLKKTLEQREQADALASIERFRADPANKYFEDVREDMSKLMVTGQAETLEDAYEKAVWLNKDVRERVLADQKAEQERQRKEAQKQAVAKAKAAGSSINGAPVATPAAPTTRRSLRDEISAAMNGTSQRI